MKMSKMLMLTMKEVPAEAEIASHQLMLRAGLMRKMVSGVYNYMPLGLQVLKKVENVVKPPQIPTFKNRISLWSRFAYFETARAIQPIASAPTTLTINVASGKPSGFFSGSSPTRYLKTAPTKPPKPTKRQFSISFTAEIKVPF